MYKSVVTTVLFCILSLFSEAQEVWMAPNAGQWDDRIEYKVELQMGALFIERDGFTFFLNDAKQSLSHSHEEHDPNEIPEKIKVQVIRSKFQGSSWKGSVERIDSSDFYTNYFLGNDPSLWKSELYSYSRMSMIDFYKGIDLRLDGGEGTLEYSLKVAPGMDPAQCVMSFEGHDKLFLDENGNLHISNRFGEIIESTPIAWTEKDGAKTPVSVEFRIADNGVSFVFPKGYDNTQTLVIDPDIVFSTFSGSTLDNWGMTATPDSQGNLYAGGIVFTGGGSYPTVAGSFDLTYNGGTAYSWSGGTLQGFDIAISKFNANGTSMIYSTYLGGSANEAPHSMVVDENDELYVFGVTSSANFPVTAGAYDVSFNGGPSVASNELGYPEGADIYVAHFNNTGSSLVGATFMGGSGTDGINDGNLNYNYGDPFRGEIIVKNGSVYVSSTTRSTNFPIVGGGQNALSGAQDAVIFKMNSNLTTLNWSTYFGGSGMESGNSLQLSSTNQLFVTGGTTSSNLPINSGNDLTYNGGISDGYLLKMNSTTGGFLAGTYIGQSEYDQCYFVQLDVDDEVYVFGQSESAYAISPGVYSNSNSGQFLRKYSNNLMNISWTTMIGAGSGHPEISPTAFLVSDCYDIYISGWGGTINTSYSNQAFYSSSSGFPITADAFQSTTNGSNFYIAVLAQDAANLKYGTYMGGTNGSSNHVDGGTSRFDKSGRIYHAVCGACGGVDYGFTTTPGVWSPTNQSNNCNLAAFKFELSTIEAIISTPNTVVCLPDPVVFSNNSANGNAFYWDFGDGTYSSDVNPTHVYPSAGTYTVILVVSDTNGCFTQDEVQFEVYIGDFAGDVVQPPGPICPGVPYQMQASGGANFLWSPAQYLDNPTSATPIATVDVTTDFMVIISDTCGIDTVYVTLPVYLGGLNVSNDTSICIGNSVNLFANGGINYTWSPPTYLDDPNSATPLCTPDVTTSYIVQTTTTNGCELTDTVRVEVYYTPPVSVMPDSIHLCLGASADIEVSGGVTYSWFPNVNITPLTGSVVTVSPLDDIWYFCDFTNACGTVRDSILVNIVQATITAGTDTIICPGQSVNLWATGGVSYSWTPASSLNNTATSLVTATPLAPTVYVVIGTDQYGCINNDSVFVDLYPMAFIQACPDVYAFYGDEIQLSATSTTFGPYIWSPAEYLSCVSCQDPIAMPNQNYGYMVTYTDENGCSAADSVFIYYDPIIYVPNTFTPGDDSMNPMFFAVGGNIRTFEMLIFNRWGELIFTSSDMNVGWDGTYQGHKCQDGTYIWKIKISDFTDEEHDYVGHVNLLRD